MVFQEQFLFPHFSVRKNLNFGRKRRRQGNSPIEFDRVVEVLELGPVLGRFPRNLSGGEKQRVALGRALLSGPNLLLLDEPLTGLDDQLKERVTSYISKAVAEWKIPTLLVSHNLREPAAAEADKGSSGDTRWMACVSFKAAGVSGCSVEIIAPTFR